MAPDPERPLAAIIEDMDRRYPAARPSVLRGPTQTMSRALSGALGNGAGVPSASSMLRGANGRPR